MGIFGFDGLNLTLNDRVCLTNGIYLLPMYMGHWFWFS